MSSPGPVFSRVAIVNRGEAAARFIHAAREFTDPTVPDGLTTIALHTAAERHALFVREADEAVCFDDLDVDAIGSPYLDLDVLAAALRAARAEAVWVGWGFVAERADFADLCASMGVTFIGPSGDVMRRLGDKIGAKLLAEEADVPMAPWSGGAVDTLDDAAIAAERVGYPLMVKAAAGGGGRGIRRVDAPEELATAFERATSEGRSAFGDPTVFLERVVTDARHVEVQVIADRHGTVWAPGVRDCSIQRRNQKVIEESASTALDADTEERLRAAAIRLAGAAGYVGAGTVEFLYQPAEDLLAFLEVNTRLQVEHPVTEVTTGLDLVKLQLRVALGHRLDGTCPEARGHAFEARLNAEDPQAGFAPASGRITTAVWPAGPGVRVDTGVQSGDEISPDYDSMIAKIICWGADRPEALGRLRRALRDTTVVVDGGTTNRSFLLDLAGRDEVVSGELDTGWLDRLTGAGGHLPRAGAEVALAVAAVELHERETALDRARLLNTAARGRPESDGSAGHQIELRLDGTEYRVSVQTGNHAGWYRVGLDGAVRDLVVARGRTADRVRIGEATHRVVTQVGQAGLLVDVDGVTHRLSRDDGGLLRAPAVSLVVSVDVAVGDEVTAGQRVAVVEAMKMETALVAAADGVVEEVHVTANTQVDAGAPILRIGAPTVSGPDDTAADADAGADETGLSFAALGGGAPDLDDVGIRLDILHATVLGFDVTDDDGAVLAAHVHDGAGGPDDGASLDAATIRERELDILICFADLCGLTRDRRTAERDQVEAQSPREHFHAYLRSFDVDHEALPARFRERLTRALAHYGVDGLDRTPELETAVHRIHRAAQARDRQLPIVAALLERRLRSTTALADRDRLRTVLDAVIAATQARYPAIGNLARSVRHQRVDRPLLDSAMQTVRADMANAVDDLCVESTDRELIDRLVASTVPLMPMIARADALASGPSAAAFVEVLTRRHYKIRSLQDGTVRSLPDTAAARAVFDCWYHHRGRDVRVLAAAGDVGDLASILADLGPLAAEQDRSTVVDCYLQSDGGVDADELAAIVDAALGELQEVAHVDRLAVVVAAGDATDGSSGSGVDTMTWIRDADGAFREQEVYRSVHPMIGRRLNLWRLENFDVDRLPSAPDTHVFECVARDQPTDERLIAVAEVRDVTPLRGADGSFVALPELERVLAACLDGIRQAQAADARRQRFEWNRVMLFVWPPVEITADEVDAVARRLAPMTTGLGLEQVMVQGRIVDPETKDIADVVVRLSYRAGQGLTFEITDPPTAPMQPLDDYTRKVLQCRRRNTVYPYELASMLAEAGSGNGEFVELDLDDTGALVPVPRDPGGNEAGIVVGLVTTRTDKFPDGMTRVALFGDPTRSMGSIAEAECLRLLAALDLAEERDLPVEWYALSAGARIAMDSGSENLDWVAAVLRRIVEFTQGTGPNREINVVVAGVNVGAQPYWNAEATMLMHTRGILVMTPDSTMVLTGKQAIDFSGGVSAEDNIGIGGHERIMGPNGQAQYWAADMAGAVDVVLAHLDHAYVAPGEPGPRRFATGDPRDRDVCAEPHRRDDGGFATVGEIFAAATNPDRKKPFDIRSVIDAVRDHDRDALERWSEMAEAEGAVVCDAHLGGWPVTVVGVESRPLPRTGQLPADGPAQWSAGTLFPLSSKKVARAINAASGNRPVVVLANLSGFDGSPESLRRLQLEYGAEIGRAIVNFDGPIVLCVVSRYHGGAFVVFSGRLNDRMQVLAVEGAHASVIGGAPAAAVVFTREVNARTQADPRIRDLEAAVVAAPPHDRARRRAELAELRAQVRNEMLGAVAAEFDAVHSVQRATEVGSVHEVVAASRLRPELIAAVERGLGRS